MSYTYLPIYTTIMCWTHAWTSLNILITSQLTPEIKKNVPSMKVSLILTTNSKISNKVLLQKFYSFIFSLYFKSIAMLLISNPLANSYWSILTYIEASIYVNLYYEVLCNSTLQKKKKITYRLPETVGN